MQMGISTPFLNANSAFKYFDLNQAYAHLKKIGKEIKNKTIPKQFRPMIFAITGRGRTAQGCLEVLENFPITKVKPDEIEKLCQNKEDPRHADTIYLVNINTEDTISPRDPEAKFDKDDYYKNPQKYKSDFSWKYLPYISALYHCIFWDSGCPLYIKNKHLKNLAEKDNLRLIGICDVTCDLNGSIQCLKKYTSPEEPFFYYNPLNDTESFKCKYEKHTIMYLGIDFLPCELAMDASHQFSKILKKWVNEIVRSDSFEPIEEQKLIPELKRAVIAVNGELTPNFKYIMKLRQQKSLKMNTIMKKTQEKKTEEDVTASIHHKNISIIPTSDLVPEKLDFSS